LRWPDQTGTGEARAGTSPEKVSHDVGVYSPSSRTRPLAEPPAGAAKKTSPCERLKLIAACGFASVVWQAAAREWREGMCGGWLRGEQRGVVGGRQGGTCSPARERREEGSSDHSISLLISLTAELPPQFTLFSTTPHPLTPNTNCTALSLIPTVNGSTVRSFSTHGQLSAAQGSPTTVSRSDIRLIQHLDSSALGLVRRWLLIGYFLILYYPPPPPRRKFRGGAVVAGAAAGGGVPRTVRRGGGGGGVAGR
jgi:hypothetical protein